MDLASTLSIPFHLLADPRPHTFLKAREQTIQKSIGSWVCEEVERNAERLTKTNVLTKAN